MPTTEQQTPDVHSAPRDLHTISQFSERFPAFTQAALRSYILNAEDRVAASGQRIAGNGLQQAGAIVRVGRKVLLSEGRFFVWIARQQKRARAA